MPNEWFESLWKRAYDLAEEAQKSESTYRALREKAEGQNLLREQVLQQLEQADELIDLAEQRQDESELGTYDGYEAFRIANQALEDRWDFWTGGMIPFPGRQEMYETDQGKGMPELRDLERSVTLAENRIFLAVQSEFISGLETEIARLRSKRIGKMLDLIDAPEFDRKTYLAMASTVDQVRDWYLDEATRVGYLAEKALAFELDEPDLQQFKLDYGFYGQSASTMLLVDLQAMYTHQRDALRERHAADEPISHPISLRQLYPVEFARLIQSGVTHFATNLYDFDRDHPGTYGRRIARVDVEVHALSGPDGIKGSLTHSGSFLMRNKEGTLATNRLLPSAKEIEEALQGARENGLAAVRLPGVTAYTLEPRLQDITLARVSGDKNSMGNQQPPHGFRGIWCQRSLDLEIATEEQSISRLQQHNRCCHRALLQCLHGPCP